MEELTILDTMTIVGFIVGIISTILAIVSIVFSALFFWWSKKENDLTATLTVKIEEKVTCLEKLFDKMYDSTYNIVLENNQAMQRHLFPGSFESQIIENKDMDVFLLIGSKKRLTKSEICTQLGITREVADIIISRMVQRGKVTVETDGETVVAVDLASGLTDSSTDIIPTELKSSNNISTSI